jgi:hypothetical protein
MNDEERFQLGLLRELPHESENRPIRLERIGRIERPDHESDGPLEPRSLRKRAEGQVTDHGMWLLDELLGPPLHRGDDVIRRRQQRHGRLDC